MFIDSVLDHIDRGIDIQYVFEMAEKARTKEDGTLVPNPRFEGKHSIASLYSYCICGHDIIYNHIATCVETGKSFIVGSECINTVCNSRKWEYTKKCFVCVTNDSMKTKNICKECSQAIKNFNKKLNTGKNKGMTYFEIYEFDKAYVAWCSHSDYKPIIHFSEWAERIKDYPALIEEYARENVSEYEKVTREKEEIEIEIRHKKERVYLNVHYEEKEKAKSMKLRWDPSCKSWYQQRSYLTHDIIVRFPPKDEETQKRLRTLSQSYEASQITHV